MTLIASSFLAGSLLTLLLPVALLIALVIWYVKFIARVPETTEAEKSAAAPNPGPTMAPPGAPNPGSSAAPGAAVPPSQTGHTPGEL